MMLSPTCHSWVPSFGTLAVYLSHVAITILSLSFRDELAICLLPELGGGLYEGLRYAVGDNHINVGSYNNYKRHVM